MISSSSFNGLSYRGMMDDVGALAKYFGGWSRADLMGLSVRERRHWVKWANAIVTKSNRERAMREWSAQQTQVQVLGR